MTTSSIGGRLGEAARGSVLVQVIARLLAAMHTPQEELPQQVVAGDLAALRSLFAGSVLASRMAAGLSGVARAAFGSRAIRAAGRRREIEPLKGWQWIRAAGIAGLAATATVGLSALVDPRPVSGYRWWLWAVAAGISVAATLGARAFDAAREGSRVVSRLE
jgi:hypothetical protein